MICPDNYTDKKGWTDANMVGEQVWSDSYFFTKFGVEGKVQVIICESDEEK